MSRPFCWPTSDDRPPVEAAEPGDDRAGRRPAPRSPCSSTQSSSIRVDVVERVRPVLVPGELDRAPDLLVASARPRSARAAAGAARARRRARAPPRSGSVAQLAQPLAQAALGLTRPLAKSRRTRADVGAQLGPRDDRVEVAEAEVGLGEAEVVGQLLARRLLDDPRAGERDQRAGLGDGDVAEAREAREHAARSSGGRRR